MRRGSITQITKLVEMSKENNKKITLIAYKEVVQKIINGEKDKEYREYKDFYHKRFKSIKTPFTLRLRGGYNKDALFVDAEVNRISVERPFINKYLARLGIGKKYYVLHLSKIIKKNFEKPH